MDGIDLDRCDHVEPGLLESKPQSAHAGEDIHDGGPYHDGSPSKKRAKSRGIESESAASPPQTTQTSQPSTSRYLTILAS